MPTIIRNAPNIYVFEGFTFVPGANFVPEKTYEIWKTKFKKQFDEVFSRQLSGSEPAMVIKNQDKEEIDSARNLADAILKMKESAAIDTLENTLSLEVLEAVAKKEARQKVKKALQRQIDEMKRIPAPEELQGGVKNYPGPKTGNLMDDLNIAHHFIEEEK